MVVAAIVVLVAVASAAAVAAVIICRTINFYLFLFLNGKRWKIKKAGPDVSPVTKKPRNRKQQL